LPKDIKGNHVMKKVLVVEDDKKISMALAIRLRAAGYQVIQAYDTIGGTSMAKIHKPNVILLDISMPGGDGFNVAQRVRKMTGPEPIIIFLTAHKELELRQRAMEFGAAGFVEKPYDARSLIELIAEAA
jgi:two-component system response regulator GlrR